MTVCDVKGCDRRVLAKKLCSAHYQRAWAYGDPTAGGPLKPPRKAGVRLNCSVPQCNAAREGHGLCSKHYKRAKRLGTLDQYSAGDETSVEPIGPSQTLRPLSDLIAEIEAALREDAREPPPHAATFGLNYRLEEHANRLLIEDRKQTGGWQHSDWLTDWQLEDRQSREIYNHNGIPEAELFEGRAFRVYNPLFGKRPRRHDAADW